MIHQTLYKIDENDNVREWFLESEGANYRTHSGIEGGKTVISKWKEAKPKNVGKANEVSAEEQCALEVERKYVEQLKTSGYYLTVEEAKEGFRTYFQPMLAEKWKDRKAKVDVAAGVYSQPKLDGCRAVSTPGELKSREGEPFKTPTDIIDLMSAIHEIAPSIVFDGELYNHAMRNDFEKIVSLIRKQKPTAEHIAEANAAIEYHIYDCYDRDRPHLKFSERQALLRELIGDLKAMMAPGHDGPERFANIYKIVLVETKLVHSIDELDEVYGVYLENQYEGQMVRLDEAYEMRRSKSLLKRKEFEDKEFKVIRVEEGVGNWAGAVKIVYIRLEDGSEQKSGVAGTFPQLAALLEVADELSETDVTIRFQGRTQYGKLRFPVAHYFWRGKRDV